MKDKKETETDKNYTIIKPGFEFIPPPEQGKELEFLELVTRNCYKSEERIKPGSAEKLLNKVVKEYKHLSVTEHANCVLEIRYPKDTDWNVVNHQANKWNGPGLRATRAYEGIDNRSVYISGNLRAWKERIDRTIHTIGGYPYGCIHSPEWNGIVDRVIEKWPFFFNCKPGTGMCSKEGRKLVYLLDENPITNRDNLSPYLLDKLTTLTYRIIGDRSMSHQLVRHRLCAFSQESQRYCVAGNMRLSFKNPHRNQTLKEFYETCYQNRNGAWKRVNIRQMNEDTGLVQYAKIKSMHHMGEKLTYRLVTKLGYSIITTLDHKILTSNGYQLAESIKRGDKIAVNGTDKLYQNKDWFKTQYKNGKSTSDIARICGIKPTTARKWKRKHRLNTETKYKHRTPWNKGLKETDDPRVVQQANALREHHWDDGRINVMPQDRIKKLSENTYNKTVKERCEICNSGKSLGVHHINGHRKNNSPENLITCCASCHSGIHNKSLKVIHYDEVIKYEYLGSHDVYDIEMDSEYHNFIANGVVVHNCNYGKKGFQVVVPPSVENIWGPDGKGFIDMAMDSYRGYLALLEAGVKPEDARGILPNCTKTEVVTTCTLENWKHIFRH